VDLNNLVRILLFIIIIYYLSIATIASDEANIKIFVFHVERLRWADPCQLLQSDAKQTYNGKRIMRLHYNWKQKKTMRDEIMTRLIDLITGMLHDIWTDNMNSQHVTLWFIISTDAGKINSFFFCILLLRHMAAHAVALALVV